MDAGTTSGTASAAPPLPDDAELSAAAAALSKHLEKAKANTAELARLQRDHEKGSKGDRRHAVAPEPRPGATRAAGQVRGGPQPRPIQCRKPRQQRLALQQRPRDGYQVEHAAGGKVKRDVVERTLLFEDVADSSHPRGKRSRL